MKVPLGFVLVVASWQLTMAQLIPYPSAREVSPTVAARVIGHDSLFSVQYAVGNRSSAKQSIEDLILPICNNGANLLGQEPSWMAGKFELNGILFFIWSAVGREPQIAPGQLSRVFALRLPGILSIVDMHLGGAVPPDTISEPDYDTTGSDIVSNSVAVPTLGTNSAPVVFDPLQFVDLVVASVVQSRALGWISSQSVADKYVGVLSRIRSDILSCLLSAARARLDSVSQLVNVDSTTTLSPEAYALIRYNGEYLRTRLLPSTQAKAGVANTGMGTISVKSRPSINFGNQDTLRQAVVSLRWPSTPTVSLGVVQSSYGFTKSGIPTTIGSYAYQQFRSATAKILSWTAGTEYELFTVPITNPTGLEQIELTNALPGGEWFVDINYLDKTDSTFYQPLAQGYVYSNKSDNGGATAYNHGRHVTVSSSKFHELYGNLGEIIYRRKDMTSGAWEATSRLSTGNGGNNDASIVVASNGYLYAVWQRYLTASTYNLSGARSTDGGNTWTVFPILGATGTITVSPNQLNIFPVVAQYSTTQIVVVFCCDTGLKYIKSTDQGATWSTPAYVVNSGSNSSLWFPSIAKGSNYLILTYDTRYSGAFSTKYNGSTWATPVNMSSAVGMFYDRYSSVVVDNNNIPLAAWCAQGSGLSDYRIVFRQGVAGGDSWSSTYTAWTQRPTGISDYYPSITAFQAPGNIGIREILWHTSNNQIGMNQWAYGTWYPSTLSTSGLWANNSANAMVRVWTDQSASPYEVKRSSYDPNLKLQSMVSGGSGVVNDRRLSLESESSGSFVSFELSPFRVVGTQGDTTELLFKPIDQSTPITLSESQSWDYLGTDDVRLPSNAKYLVFDADIQNITRQDSTNSKSTTNIFTGKTLAISVVKGGKKSQVYSESSAQSGRKIIDISAFAGQTVAIRPSGSATRKGNEAVSVAVGDIYAPKK